MIIILSVEKYFNSGYNLNIQDKIGYTPLMRAKNKNYLKIFKLLLNAGADMNIQVNNGYNALIWAAANGHIEFVKLLLNAGADPNKQNSRGYTAIKYSIIYRNIEMVKLLLDYHADEFLLDKNEESFFDKLFYKEREYFLKEYPNKVYNAISNWYKKSFTEFVKDYNIKN